MLRRQPGDQPQDRALAAAAGTEDADELALVGQVLDEEAHIANGRVLVGLPDVVGLRDVAELDHAGQPPSWGGWEAIDDLAHADRQGAAALRRSVSGGCVTHGFPRR